MPKGGLGSAKEALIIKTHTKSIVRVLFKQMDVVRHRVSQTNFPGVFTKWDPRLQAVVGETASRVKAIHVHYPISSATITSSPRHFQVDLSPLRLYCSCQPSIHTATRPTVHPSISVTLLITANWMSIISQSIWNLPPYIQFKKWLRRNNSRREMHSDWSQVFP